MFIADPPPPSSLFTNKIQNEGAIAIARALKKNQTLLELE